MRQEKMSTNETGKKNPNKVSRVIPLLPNIFKSTKYNTAC